LDTSLQFRHLQEAQSYQENWFSSVQFAVLPVPLLEFHPLTEALLPAALDLDCRCFGGLWTEDGYRREIASPNSELLVLKQVEGKIQNSKFTLSHSPTSPSFFPTSSFPHLSISPSSLLGLGCYWAILEEAHITILAVDPQFQRQGLGQALLCALLSSAYQRKLEWATLEVRISNQSAVSLYEKFGFREAGRRRRYYQDTGEDALVLWRGGLQDPKFPRLLQDWQVQVRDRLHRSDWQFATPLRDANLS
jgi:ribosomal-protein-alanine N-acetyltransferase